MNGWHLPMEKWDSWESSYFVKWFAEVGVGFNSMSEVLEGYRAVRDVEASVVVEPINQQPTKIITSAGMVKMAQQILNESIKEAYEEHEYNQP